MSDAVRIVIIEDHALTRAGLRGELQAAGMEVVGEAADGIAGLDVVAHLEPDVAIVDIGLPGRDGIALTREIKALNPKVAVVILTMADLDRNVRAALQAGADAYCVKTSDPTVVISAVRAVAAGGAYFDPQIARAALNSLSGNNYREADLDALTEREINVLALIADGRSNSEIAEKLYLSLGTVKGHIADILAKLSASDRAQAAVIAFRRGLLS
jgi:NarL family two-component system response regulator LiaR